MRKTIILTWLGCLLFATNVRAQVDPDPDMIGFYFDQNATVYCTFAPVGEPFTAYLCLTNCTAPSGVSGWECRPWITPGIFVLSWYLHGNAVNSGIPPDIIVGLGNPLPWASSIVLMDVEVGVFIPGVIEFKVYPANAHSLPPNPDGCALPAYAVGDDPSDLRSLGFSAGYDPATCEPYVCAVINGECSPAATAESTWGGIKAMYK